MSVPPKRLAKRRKRIRASHSALTGVSLTTCEKCKKPILPHRACPHCGFYRGRNVRKIASTKKSSSEKSPSKQPKTEEKKKKAAA